MLKVVLTVGLPGCGKSTYLASLGVNPISTDAIRLQLTDDETDQTANSRVFATARYLFEQRLALLRTVTYIDATNLTRRDRRPFVELARKHGCEAEALFFDIPLAVCRTRNAARVRNVPEHVLHLMAAKLIPPSLAEGFSRIECVRYPPGTHPSQSAD